MHQLFSYIAQYKPQINIKNTYKQSTYISTVYHTILQFKTRLNKDPKITYLIFLDDPIFSCLFFLKRYYSEPNKQYLVYELSYYSNKRILDPASN